MTKILRTFLVVLILFGCRQKSTDEPKGTALTKFNNEDVARYTISSIMNQSPDIIAVKMDGAFYVVSYIRKSDGQEFLYKIKVEDNIVTWGNLDGRWRDTADDEKITFEEKGDSLEILQTFSDGSISKNQFGKVN
jgi:hypothetical protein